MCQRLTLATPLDNVFRVEEVCEPSLSGQGFAFGALFTAAGAVMLVDAATRSTSPTGGRIAEAALSPLLLAPSVFAIAADVYGLGAASFTKP